ncbi:site-specific integrase [Methylocystis parvus]|uniref:Site-specific integrase n=1 Tax=Methylocystis parvus TaxID=134 RepID=A0A6B8M5M8_9HYPH|nr:site-specific integrase [Methylocystis parvus]QGM97716.1 site-specific integrase [Methylocystis parvus]WBK01982.1 site-specific integrase [Methylocystis parvus OBBP]
MPVIKITKRAVDALAPGERPFIAFDTDLAGFGIRVMPSGAMSYVVEYRPHGGGRGVAKRRVTIGRVGALTPDQARKAAADMLAQVRLGGDPGAEKAEKRKALTVAGLCDAFETEHLETKVKDGTAEAHSLALKRLKDAHGSVKAEALSRGQVSALHSKMRDTPYAANRALAVWSKLYSWAGVRGLVPEGFNPARGIEKYREQGRERFLTGEEFARLGDALRLAETEGLPWDVDETKPGAKHLVRESNRRRVLDPFAVAAIRLLILTGARLREILHAKWSQVDVERGVIFLPDSKTGKKPVYLSAAAQEVLASLPRIEGNPHIIAGANVGAPRADLKKPWAAVTRAGGLEGVRLHDLRHSFASFGAGASLGLPIIGKLLGHTQAATTQRYAHLDADPLRRAVDTIGATISAAMDGDKKGEVVQFKRSGSNSAV